MTTQEIIEKYKKYLTKNQIKGLVEKSEQYKLINAGRRAQAQSELNKQYRASRRSLQNIGLASRQGKIISGREAALKSTLDESYDAYNRQLRQYESALTEQAAVKSANATIKARKKAAEEAAAAAEAAKQAAEREQEVMRDRRRKMAQDQLRGQQDERFEGIGMLPATNRNEYEDPRIQPMTAPEKVKFAEQLRHERANYNEYEDPRIQQMSAPEKKQISEYLTFQHNMDKAKQEFTAANANPKANNPQAEAARKRWAEGYVSNMKEMFAQGEPQNVQDLLNMNADDFAVAYDAAEKLYKSSMDKVKGNTWDAIWKSIGGVDTGYSKVAAEKDAMEKFAPYARAKQARDAIDNAEKYAYWSTYMVDGYKTKLGSDWVKAHLPDRAKGGDVHMSAWTRDDSGKVTYDEMNGGRYQFDTLHSSLGRYNLKYDRAARMRYAESTGYSAADYDRTHGTGDSKYAAAVFEYSLINGDATKDYNIKTAKMGEDAAVDKFFRDVYKAKGLTGKEQDEYRTSVYLAHFMTDEERELFGTLYEKYGAKKADEYFEFMRNSYLSERALESVEEIYKNIENGTPLEAVWYSIYSTPLNLTQGIVGAFNTLISGTPDTITEKLRAQRWNGAKNIRSAVSNMIYNKNTDEYGNVTDWGKFAGGFGYSTLESMVDSTAAALISKGVGNIAQGLGVGAELASKIGSAIGGMTLGGSAFNDTYDESLRRGLTPEKARLTALGAGINEMLFETLSIGTLLEKTGKTSIKVARSNFINGIVNVLIQGGVEGSEEVFTSIANMVWDELINKYQSEYKQDILRAVASGKSYEEVLKEVGLAHGESLLMDFIGGLVSGVAMSSGGQAINRVVNADYYKQNSKYQKFGKNYTNEQVQELKSFDFTNKQAQELAQHSKLSNDEIGYLAVMRDQQLQQNALDYNAKLLKEGKITAEVKKLFDRFIENPGLVENQDGGLTDFNGKEVFTADDVAQMAKYDKYLQNAVDIRGNQDALIQQREEQAQALAEQQKRLDNPLITNEERAQRVGQEFGTQQIGARERIAGDMAFQRGASDAAAASPSVNKSVIEGMKLKDAVTVKGNKVDTKKGVVTFDYGNNKTTDTMTNDQLVALRYAQGMANITGSNIKVESEFVGRDKTADGFYNPETDTVHINLKGKNSMVYTLAHELTHRIAKLNKAAYADLLKAVKEELSRSDLNGDALPEVYQEAIGKYMDGETSLLDALRKYEKEHYARNGIILDKDGGTKEVDEEIVCKCCETFLADPRFVQNMVTKHKTGAKAVYSFLKDVYNDMKALFGLAERNADEEGKGNAANISAESDILAQFGNIDRIFKLWSRAVKQMQKQTAKTQQGTAIKYRASDVGMTDEKLAQYDEYVDNALAGEGNNKAEYIPITPVSAVIREGLKRFNVILSEDAEHRITDNNVRHVRKSHGIEKEGAYGITDGDVHAIPYIIHNADGAYYRTTKKGDQGVVYVLNHVDTTYYVEGITEDGNLTGVQMMKAPLGDIPDAYKNDIVKEKALIGLPNGFYTPKSYVQAATRDHASKHSIPSDIKSVKMMDENYLSLAQKVKDGTATDADKAELRKQVDAAARAAGAASLSNGKVKQYYHGTGEDFTSFNIDKSARGIHGYGFYVSAIKDVADHYAPTKRGKVLPLYLMTDRLATREDHRITAEMIGDIVQKYDIPGDLFQAMTPSQMVENESDAAIIKRLEAYLDDETTAKPSDYLKTFREVFGYDGLRMPGENVVWSNDLLKSADLVTYDNDGKIIPLSERFKTDRTGEEAWKNEDIRYSVSTDVSTAIENNGVVVDKQGEPVLKVHDHGDGGVQYSYSTWKKEGRDTLKSFMKKDTENYAKKRRKELRESGKSKAEVKAIVDSEVADMRTQYERIMKQMDKIYDISEKYLDKYASFGTWSRADVTVDKDGKPVFSVIRANGEYPMNIDFSLVCVKRRALDAVLNEIVRRGFMEKLVLDGESLVKVNDIIRKRGFEVACMGCFVEAKRFRQQGVAEGFAEKYNEIVKSLGGEAAYANFGQDESVKQSEGITGKKDSELNWSRVNELIEQYNKKKAANSRAGMTVEEAIAFELKENPKSRVLLKSGDFMSTRGMDRVAKDAPSILTLYNKQKGTGGPKAVFGDMQYLNDVCKKQWNVNKAYAVGGVRVQSFSDFVPRMFFDYCQMVADLATRKLPAHAYTKEESFVRLYGLTGMKINMSLFPKVGNDGLSAGLQYMRDKNGDIVYKDGKPVKTYAWAGESFNYDVAKEIQADAAYGKNCGTIAVGISNEQIRMMMADPTIRMIIPYHKSSLNPVIAEMMGIQGFTDYTEYQRTKLDGKAIDVDFAFNQRLHEVGDPQAVVKEYLGWCKENGYTAKFEQFAYNEDGSINENYYKLLEDFTLYDEQGNYCPQEAVQMVYPENMDALLDKYLKQDSDMQEARDAMIPAVADEIIRAMDRKASMSNTDFKTDKLGGKEYLKYLQLGAKVVNQTATEAEIREFKQRMVQLSEDNRMAFLDKLREKMIRADEAAKVREVRDRQIARLKEEFKESKEKARERRIRSDLTNTLKKGNDRIVQLLARPTENAHVPVQLAQAVSEYAMRLNQLLTTSEPKTGEFAGMEKQTQKGALNAQKILDAYRRSFADEETIALAKAENPKYDPRGLLPTSEYDEQLIKMIEAMDSVIQGKRMSDLTTDELRLVMNTMRGVIHAVTDANKLIGTNENKTIWKAGDQMVEQLENAPSVSQKIRGYLETSLDLRRLAKIFSGSNENAEFVKLVKQLNDGAIEKERIAQTLQSIFKPVTDQYGDEIRKWYGKKAEWIDTGITKNGKKVEITKGMRVSLALHVLNEGNMRHIENGGLTIPNREMYRKGNLADAYANGELVRLNAEQIDEIISHMTEAEKAYVEAAKELFHKRTGYFINKTSLALLGYRKATVENYFPIHTDKNFTKTDFASLKQDGSIEGQGFLKERVNASNPVYLEDITSVVNRQIRGVALYAGLAIPMRNFNAVTNASIYEDDNGVWSPRTTVKQTMTQKMGEYGRKVVEGFLADASEMSHVDVTPMERFAGKMAKRYVQAVLLMNLKVSLKQVASYPTAAAVIPWKYLGKALLAGGKNHRLISRADVDLINQYTPLYQMRRESRANEIASIMAKRGIDQKLPALMGWITKFDVATVGRLWSAAEYMVADQQKNLPVGSDEYYKAVAKVFNDTVQQTQPNFTPLQRNAALRSKSDIVRSLVLFGTQRMQNGGILMEAAYELKHSKGKSKAEIQAARQKLGRAVASQVVQNILLIAASMLVDAVRGRMKSWQDDDKEITAESLAKGMGDMFLSNAIGSFLGGSEVYDLVSALYKKATGGSVYDIDFTIPAVDSAKEILNFLKDAPDVIAYWTGDHTDEEKLNKAKNWSMQLAKVFGYATGIPIENAVKDLFKGIIPAFQDLADAKKTGELIPWLHQSGKLDSKKTSARYKEWVNEGRKGSEFFYWQNKLNIPGGRDAKTDVLNASDLSAEDKARIFVLFDDYGATQDGTKVYKANGDLYYDFANAEPISPIESTLNEIAEASEMLTAEPTATPNPLPDAKQEGVKQAVAQGVPEQTATDAFLTYQNIGQVEGRDEEFREWLFKNVDDPHQRAVLDYQVIGRAAKIEGAVTYKDNGTVYRDYTDANWYKLSNRKAASDGTNKRYDAAKKLEKTGLTVDKTVSIYDKLDELTKKAEWTEYLKKNGMTDEQINIFLWSRGWAKLK